MTLYTKEWVKFIEELWWRQKCKA